MHILSAEIAATKRKKEEEEKEEVAPLPVVVLWRADFIQAPGSGIISMQMFLLFLFTAAVIGAGSREDESGGRVRRLSGRVVALS